MTHRIESGSKVADFLIIRLKPENGNGKEYLGNFEFADNIFHLILSASLAEDEMV